MSAQPQVPAGANPEDFKRWLEREARQLETRAAKHEGMEWGEVMQLLEKLPPETAEDRAERLERQAAAELADRLAAFRKICPPEFMARVDRAKLTDGAAFDHVSMWNGGFPGAIATGPTGTSKSRACWSALGRLNVREGKSFAWFPVKRLITEFVRYENKDLAEEFYRNYRHYDLLFVDDLDKFNSAFESEGAALFQFYDWVYREHRPVLTTTNKGREWWENLMGEAFARRLFDDAHREEKFSL